MTLFNELKRRNVFKVAASYAIVSWIVLQVADTTFPALNIPGWVMSLITILILLGFPIAMFLAWAFEMTPEGIKPTAEVPLAESIRAQTGQKMNHLVMGGLVVILVLVMLDAYVFDDTPAVQAITVAEFDDEQVVPSAAASIAPAAVTPALEAADAKSVAVLPFANLSDDPEQEYFSDGLTEELINKLSQVDDLLVTGRNSSFYFKDRDDELRDIGQQLGVAHLLQGSVRKAGTQLRITAQLMDVNTNTNLWSQNFDREAADIFAIQDEIAAAVTRALSVTLRAGALSQPGMTSNVEAYEEFLQGQSISLQIPGRAIAFTNAIEHLQTAVQLDPAFAEGWVELARAYRLGIIGLPPDQTTGFSVLLDDALDRAEALAPELPSLVLSTAYQQTMLERNYGLAEAMLKNVLDNPGGDNGRAASTVSSFLWVTGRAAESLAYARQARRLEPKDPLISFVLSNLLLNAGRIDEALAEIERGLTIGGNAANFAGLRLIAAMMRQDREAAMEALQNFPADSIYVEIASLWREGDNAAALALVRKFIDAGNLSNVQLVIMREWAAVLGAPELGLELLNDLSFTPGDIWLPLYADIRKLPGFKDFVREQGLLDYWRTSGNWPDYCRPLAGTENDFECF